MKSCRTKLLDRSDIIKEFTFQSKERIMLDEGIKFKFETCEALLVKLRKVFKDYMHKNKRTIDSNELDDRRKNIDLLRTNLNLLIEEFKA